MLDSRSLPEEVPPARLAQIAAGLKAMAKRRTAAERRSSFFVDRRQQEREVAG